MIRRERDRRGDESGFSISSHLRLIVKVQLMKMRIVREESIRKNSGEVQLYVVFVFPKQRHYQT